MGNVVLIATYEMGRQPFGLASPSAWLRRAGAEVTLLDLAVTHYDRNAVASADLVALYLPMHTATRLAGPVVERVRRDNPGVHIACYGLYAPLNATHLRERGADTILGAEFERELTDLYLSLVPGPAAFPEEVLPDPHTRFIVPDRSGLPEAKNYARLRILDEERVTGYTEATRGCRHTCRHCPVAPMYQGRFVVVPPDVVMEDIRRQVAGGARHITFGDPDFFNGPAHARRVVTALHEEFPDVTYDATIKVEHVIAQQKMLEVLRRTGCAMVTSAFEAFDDNVLAALEKGHTAEDVSRAVTLLDEAGLALNATFVAFSPWTTRRSYLEFLHRIVDLGLIDSIAPIQYAIRLLIVDGSGLLDIPDIRDLVTGFDRNGLSHRWSHADPVIDDAQQSLLAVVEAGESAGASRAAVFSRVWEQAHALLSDRSAPKLDPVRPEVTVPYFTEPWFC